MNAIAILGLIAFCVILFIVGVNLFAGTEKATGHVMTPAEEAKYELHPTVQPGTVMITDENVNDIINQTIEEGQDHPALKKRKSE